MIGSPAEVTYFVPDLELAKVWYMALFGTPIFESPEFCLFQGPGIQIGLHPADDKSPARSGGQVVYWAVRDLDQAREFMERIGCQRYRGPIIGVDGFRVCQMQDPFGNVWGLREA
ncbi:MAG: bleomycin resistance protein [Sulfobacillus benefaciens]|uniref:Bleomycin resistance protein n=1 Tax=Sulfobacillus benefaciens TaxID=453960 RepID=A0A2T2XI34_9FIRM|nr:MAG: bleomycin resistance protein [Sulfobacillus benefaciens]